jgi:hypothetical protein
MIHFIRRHRYVDEMCDSSSPVALVNKNGASLIPVTNSSQMATTTFINEPGKETKIKTFIEKSSGSTAPTDFVVGMPTMGNGHTGTNGLLANGSADPSELRLLQHEHH